MFHRRIHLFLTLLLISLPLFAGAGQPSEISLGSGPWQIIATIHRQGRGLRENEVLTFRSFADGTLLERMKSGGFETPVLFRYNAENFVHVSTTPAGSAGFVDDTIFWIAPDATMHQIDFENAAQTYEDKIDAQEVVNSSGSGLDSTGEGLKFEFYIANKVDPQCCPTAGKVNGSYQIVGNSKFDRVTRRYSCTFKMVVKQSSRTPVSNDEISPDFARLEPGPRSIVEVRNKQQ
jgi:hypothetical protein